MNASWIAAGIALAATACTNADDDRASAIESYAIAPTGYHVIKLGGLGDPRVTTSNGNSVNNLGWVAGTATRTDGSTHATGLARSHPVRRRHRRHRIITGTSVDASGQSSAFLAIPVWY